MIDWKLPWAASCLCEARARRDAGRIRRRPQRNDGRNKGKRQMLMRQAYQVYAHIMLAACASALSVLLFFGVVACNSNSAPPGYHIPWNAPEAE